MIAFLTTSFTLLSKYIIVPLSQPVLVPAVLLSILGIAAFGTVLGSLGFLGFYLTKWSVLGVGFPLAKLVGFGIKGFLSIGLGLAKLIVKGIISTLYMGGTDTLFSIIFVFACMAALAKFTLTRRTRDYTKWVSF